MKEEKMFVNLSGENFMDDFLNRIGPSVGQSNAISIKNEALIWALHDALIAKEIITEGEFEGFVKKRMSLIEEAVAKMPRPSPIQVDKKP